MRKCGTGEKRHLQDGLLGGDATRRVEGVKHRMHVGRLGLRAFCVVALSLSGLLADPAPAPPPPASVVALSSTALQITITSATDHTSAMRYAIEVDDDGNAQTFDTVKFLLRNGVLDSSPAWLRLDTGRTLVIPLPGLQVNTLYRFRVRTRRGEREEEGEREERGPVSAYSPVVSVHTLAVMPLRPEVRAVAPDKLRIKIQPGNNPAHTTYAIQASSQVTVFLHLQRPGDRPTAILGAAEEWHTMAEWGRTTGVVNMNLVQGTSYSYRVKARNGDLRETALGLAGVETTSQPRDARALWLPDDAAHQENGWTKEGQARFLAEQSVTYRWRFDQSPSSLVSLNDPFWEDSLEPVTVTFRSEGGWYFHLQGYQDSGGTIAIRSPHHFRLGYDTTPPVISRPTARGILSPSDSVPLTSGEPTTLTNIQFQWTLPPGECTIGTSGEGCRSDVSPIRGFTVSFERSLQAIPPMDASRLSTETTAAFTVPSDPAVYYCKVRALDTAGNWGPPSPPFVYRVTTQQASPTVQITLHGRVFHRQVQHRQQQAQWLIGTPRTADAAISFSEVMDPQSVAATGAITLRTLFNNAGRTIETPVNGVLEGQGRTFTLRPQQPLNAGWTYVLEVTRGVRSVNGRPLQEGLVLLFTTALDPQQSNRVQTVDNPTTLTLPPNAIAQLGHIGLSEDPLQAPLAAGRDPQALVNATDGLLRTLGASARAFALREFIAFTPQGDPLPPQLQTPAQLVLPLPARGAPLARTASVQRPGAYGVYFFDPSVNIWLRVPAQEDLAANTLVASVTQLGVYGVFLAPDLDLSQAIAFPVPFKPSDGHQKITFANLSTEATIKIYTINGELVRTLSVPSGDRVLPWDVTNDRGEPLASDVFIYVIENSGQRKIGKLMVIR